MAVSKILAALFLSVALCESSMAATVYHVGDSIGWTTGKVNYTLWAETKLFVLGDTIVFEYNKQFHSVLAVTYENFKSCNLTAPLAKFTSGNDSFTISRYGHYYYICGAPGHCKAGMKVDVRVPRPHVSPTPTPIPSPIPSPKPWPPSSSPSPSPSPYPDPSAPPSWPPSSPPPASGWEPSPSPYPGMAPAPAPWWGMAPAPAPSAASSLYASAGLFGRFIPVLALIVAAFAY